MAEEVGRIEIDYSPVTSAITVIGIISLAILAMLLFAIVWRR